MWPKLCRGSATAGSERCSGPHEEDANRSMLDEILRLLAVDPYETQETRRAAREYLAVVFDVPSRPPDSGHDARPEITASYQKSLVSIAKRYMGRGPRFVELIHYGNRGLSHYLAQRTQGDAPQSSHQDQSLMQWWMRTAINEAIAARPPALNHLLTVQKHLRVEFEREPTDDEIALEMGMIETEDAVQIQLSRRASTELDARTVAALAQAVAEVQRLRQMAWPNLAPIPGVEDMSPSHPSPSHPPIGMT